MKWVLKFYEQDLSTPPRIIDIMVFDTEEEALKAWYNSRYTSTAYYWWSYPEKVTDIKADWLVRKYKKR